MKKYCRLFFIAALCLAATVFLPRLGLPAVSVSTTANGRELPIYCVDTDKPQIALSFDAAWGNG